MKWFYGFVLDGPYSYLTKTKEPKENSYALLPDAKKDLCRLLSKESVDIENLKREIWAQTVENIKEI